MENNYYVVLNNKELIGFYCIGDEAKVPHETSNRIYADERYVDIGLGMKPDLTGARLGREFVEFIINCVESKCLKRKYD